MKSLLMLTIFAALSFHPEPLAGRQIIDVILSHASLPDTGTLYGISNIFFDTLSSNKIKHPAEWKDVEIADLVEDESLVPIRVIRYRNHDGTLIYVVDTDGDSDFQHGKTLQFRKQTDRSIADVTIKMKPISVNQPTPMAISYQVVLADHYTYCRISEYRKALLRVGGNNYELIVRNSLRNHPFYDLSPATIIQIDFNHDGEFLSKWQVTQHGDIIPTEEIDITEPFIVGGKKFKAVSIDSLGSTLSLQEVALDTALAVGFKAPFFEVLELDGKRHTLGDLRGRIIMLEFWSPECPFCPTILPNVNAIVKKYKSPAFVAIAPSGKSTSQDVQTYLINHPYEPIVGAPSKELWQRYDRREITPLFYVIDQNGYIRLAGPGTSIVPVVDKMIERLMNSK